MEVTLGQCWAVWLFVLLTIINRIPKAEARSIDGGTSRVKRSADSNAMEMHFTMDGKTMSLNLQMNTDQHTHVPLYINTNGSLSRQILDSNQTFQVYENRRERHSIVVREMTSANGSHITEYMGSFYSNGRMYSLMPMSAMQALHGNMVNNHTVTPTSSSAAGGAAAADGVNGMTMVDFSGQQHFIQEAGQTEDYKNDTVARDGIQRAPNTLSQDASPGKQRYFVDYVAVTDYAIYNRWYSASSKNKSSERNQEATMNIYFYYTNIVSGINMRYASINETDFSIGIRSIGIVVSPTVGESPWTERDDIAITWNGDRYTDMYRALDYMRNYVKNNSMLTSADHVALFSGNDLYDGYITPNGRPSTKSGLADVSGVCQLDRRVSVCYEFGQYSTITTAAHELGHNLGSYHDGYGNTCTQSDQYIMASAPGLLDTPTKFNNSFRFSPCSIQAFRTLLTSLTTTNCLLVNSSSPAASGSTSLTPGQAYTVNQQCQQLIAGSSFYCAGMPNDQTICSSMKCWYPSSQQCFATIEQRAYDGTTCGNRMWCQQGRCVSDSAAPAANSSCVYGDFRAPIDVEGQKLTCSQIASQRPEKCYDESIAGQCCRSCAAIRQANSTGCEYGDKSPGYCAMSPTRNCYDAGFRATCCSTCAKQLRVHLLGLNCAYGDRADWCKTSALKPSHCYETTGTGATCCEACSNYYTGRQGCEYGDHAGWCGLSSTQLSTSSCSAASSTNDLGYQCCDSCARYLPQTNRTTTTTSSPSPSPTTTTPTSSTPSTTTTVLSSTRSSSTSSSTTSSTTTASTQKTTATPSVTTRPTTTVGSSSTTRTSTTTTSRQTQQQCPQGDTAGSNYCSTVTSDQCYQASGICCSTCQRFYTASPGCEFGDKASWCPSYVQSAMECRRPEVASLCCKACAVYNSNNNNNNTGSTVSSTVSNCRDAAPWCPAIFPGQCYDPATESTCCATCSSRKLSNANCRYGDKFSWCKAEYCSTNAADCCISCR